MIMGIHEFVLSALLAEYLQRAIRHHFVDVHVAGRAGATLDHVDAEMVVMQSFADLGCRLTNRIDDIAIEQLHLEVGKSGCFLYCGECGDQRSEFAQLDPRDAEVLNCAKGLYPVKRAGRYITLCPPILT